MDIAATSLPGLDIAASLALLALVLTPLGIVVHDLWAAGRSSPTRHGMAPRPAARMLPPAAPYWPADDPEDTMPCCLRREAWDAPTAWFTDPPADDETHGAAAVARPID